MKYRTGNFNETVEDVVQIFEQTEGNYPRIEVSILYDEHGNALESAEQVQELANSITGRLNTYDDLRKLVEQYKSDVEQRIEILKDQNENYLYNELTSADFIAQTAHWKVTLEQIENGLKESKK